MNLSKMPPKIKYSLLGLLVLATATTLTTSYWYLGMAGITTFFLAYVSKGMRRYRHPMEKEKLKVKS